MAPIYAWDKRSLRYRDMNTGRYISFIQSRLVVDRFLIGTERDILRLGRRLTAGAISLAQWQSDMAEYIRGMHLASAAALVGGWDQMRPEYYGRVSELVERQLRYLQRFALQIESGRQPLGDSLLYRSRLYAQAARGTGEEVRRMSMERIGYTEEQRLLGAAEHCRGCLDQSAKGWRPIGTLEPIGSMECLSNCHCHFVYR